MKHSAGAVTSIVIVGGLICLSVLASSPAAAQGFVTPTPLPAIATQQAQAAQQLGSIQAANAQADQLDAQAAEIRRNADAQAQQAAQAYADARAATAAQNAAAIGEAIGRGEAALEQIKASLDGALKINDDRATINTEQAALINTLYISVTQQGADLQQARIENANLTRINAALQKNNETLTTQAQHNTTSANVLGIVPLFLMFLFLIGLIVLALGIRQWRNGNGAVTVTTEHDDEPSEDDEPPIEGEYTNDHDA